MEDKVSVVIAADQVDAIRAKMASVDVQIADLKVAFEAHQRHVRKALLNVADGKEADGSR